jgi:hypothetical protein
MKKLAYIFLLLISTVVLAEDDAISVTPAYVIYDTIDAGEESDSATITIENTGYSSGVTIGTVALSASHASEFGITSDGCSNQTLAQDETCIIQVKFAPLTSGTKSAVVDIPYGSGDEQLSVFVTNYESTELQVKNHLPPTMYALDISEEMNASYTYTLSWTAMGYHEGYEILLVMFDCTDISAGSCGSSYSNSEKFYETSFIASSSSSSGEWSSNGVTITNFEYTTDFTVPDTREDSSAWSSSGTSIVMRFYAKSTEDSAIGKSSLSLVIPGGLSDNYYDTSGRKIQKTICPSGGCVTE